MKSSGLKKDEHMINVACLGAIYLKGWNWLAKFTSLRRGILGVEPRRKWQLLHLICCVSCISSTLIAHNRMMLHQWPPPWRHDPANTSQQVYHAEQLPRPTIPHVLHFTGRYSSLDDVTIPPRIRKNAQHSIDVYNRAWNTSTATVFYWNDPACRVLIQTVVPGLEFHFDNERQGKYRSDMCRAAALYVHGGYYMDLDMRALRAVRPDESPQTSMITVMMPWSNGYFQSFWASSPEHPMARKTLELFLEYYTITSAIEATLQNPELSVVVAVKQLALRYNFYKAEAAKIPTTFTSAYSNSTQYTRKAVVEAMKMAYHNHRLPSRLLGPSLLKEAVDRALADKNNNQANFTEQNLLLLQESRLTSSLRKRLQIKFQVGRGGFCNLAVHDQNVTTAYFYSRWIGTTPSCRFDHQSNIVDLTIWPYVNKTA